MPRILPPVLATLMPATPAFFIPHVGATTSSAPLALVASGSGTGNMWAAVKVPAGVRHIEFYWHVQNLTLDVAAWHNYIFADNGTLKDFYGLTAMRTDEVYVHLDGTAAPTVHHEVLMSNGWRSTGYTRIGCPTCDPIPASFTFVTTTARGDGPWNFSVRTNDVSTVAAEWDDTAYLYRARDFSGDLNAQIAPGFLVRANLNTTRTISATNDAFIGWYRGGGAYGVPRSMSMESDGGTLACPCTFYDAIAGPAARGPGAYRFHLSEAAVENDVLLFAADIRLPS